MKLVYYYDNNLEEPKPGDLLFLWEETKRGNAKFNFVGIVVSTLPLNKIQTSTHFPIETVVLKPDGTITNRDLIWSP
jgi:hypothetical protein